jgi:hypothetical protein
MNYIYESPDGGDTIYRRESGKSERTLHHVSDRVQAKQQLETQWLMWRQILADSRDNPALQEALERAKIIYELSRRDKG